MTYESFELVELGKAEVAIEIMFCSDTEEIDWKYLSAVAPYVEFVQ
jgi:hypothetical protein